MTYIPHDNHSFKITDRSQTEGLAGTTKEEQVPVNGRHYALVTVEKNMTVLGRVSAIIAAVVLAPFTGISDLIKQTEHTKEMWTAVFAGKTVKRLAVDLSSEITFHALNRGLIPKLAVEGKESAWAPIHGQTSHAMLTQIIQGLASSGRLAGEIKVRQQEIALQKESFRENIKNENADPAKKDVYRAIVQCQTLTAAKGGLGGAYFLEDQKGKPKFVVKPNDEDTLCLNNRKNFACPLIIEEFRVREDIPTYESAQNEALASDIAELVGLRPVVPVTVMVILKNEGFHLITDGPKTDRQEEEENIRELIDPNGKEKLCSAQEFVENSEDLFDLTERMSDLPEQSIKFDQDDFEMANIFTWITGDKDAHTGNYRVYDKPDGSKGLKKIDSGVICGEGGFLTSISNALTQFEQIKKPLSDKGHKCIASIPLDQIVERMRFFGKSEASILCLTGRVTMMQALVANHPEFTLEEINTMVSKNYSGLGDADEAR